jgi:hypothetical protein
MMTFANGRAVLIGVSEYSNVPTLDVPHTANDVAEVAAALRDKYLGGYPEAQVQVVVGVKATRQGVLDVLDVLVAASGTEDTAFLFYSRHGEYDAQGGYHLLTQDVELDATQKIVAGTGVAANELTERLNRLRARRAVLIFNACHSGMLGPDRLGSGEREDNGDGDETVGSKPLPLVVARALLVAPEQGSGPEVAPAEGPPLGVLSAESAAGGAGADGGGRGRVVVTACAEGQFSYFDRQGEITTVFGRALAAALHGEGVPTRKGYISALDLYGALHERVSSEVAKRWGQWKAIQEPELTVLKGAGPLAVALHRGASPAGTLGPRDCPTTLAGRIHAVNEAESHAAFQQLLKGNLNVAAARDLQVDNMAGRDQLIVQGGVNSSIQRADLVGQTFDDRRQGIFGGEFHGNAIGVVEGSVAFDMGSGIAAGRPTVNTVQAALSRARQAVQGMRRRGAEDLAEDLGVVVSVLEQAMKAEEIGRVQRRMVKLDEARETLGRLAADEPSLKDLLQAVTQAIHQTIGL